MSKPRKPVWLSFIVTSLKPDKSPKAVKCKFCGWESVANATRMEQPTCRIAKPNVGDEAPLAMDSTSVETVAASSSNEGGASSTSSSVAPNPHAESPGFETVSPSASSSTSVFTPPKTVPASSVALMPFSTEKQAASPTEPHTKRLKANALVSQFLDHKFSASQQLAAEKAQAFMCVMNGFSYNSQESAASRAFYTKLRGDFVPPSVYKLEKHLDQIFVSL